ncbi:hypothetical protein [Aquipluma nitroreducens]|nr:hypothetical protein [Aquipluma nitroreducens]
MMNEKRKGIWIPIELMSDKKLDWANKALLFEIASLHELPGGCIASNEHFAELLGIKSPAASKRVTKLKELGYISTEDVYKKRSCVGRIITPLIKITVRRSSMEENAPTDQTESSSEEQKREVEQEKIAIPEIKNNEPTRNDVQHRGTSDRNNTPPEEPEGTSHTIIGVLPKELGGTSLGNTINTSINSDIKDHLLYQYTGKTGSFNSFDDLFISEEEVPTDLTTSDSSSSTGNNPALPKISTKEFRVIMNDFFEGYSSWEADMYALGLEKFIGKTEYFHSNDPKYIGLIREFYEL